MSDLKNEREWIKKIQAGDDQAFAAMFRTYHVRLCTFACRYVRSQEVAKDLVQDIFLSIWRNRTHWNPEGTLRSYLYRAVRNGAINHHKRQQTREGHAGVVIHTMNSRPQSTPLEELSYKELEARLQQAIRQLPERRRLVFTLSRVHGLSYDEIAEALDISVNTVHTQIKRAIAFLREHEHYSILRKPSTGTR